MKNLKLIIGILIIAATISFSFTSRADNSTNAPVKLYPLKTCLVCDMELGMMGNPYVFTNANQEIKLCSKSEKAEFDKDPKKYLKKLADAEAKLNR